MNVKIKTKEKHNQQCFFKKTSIRFLKRNTIFTIGICLLYFLGLLFNLAVEVTIGCSPEATLSYVVFTPASIVAEELIVAI